MGLHNHMHGEKQLPGLIRIHLQNNLYMELAMEYSIIRPVYLKVKNVESMYRYKSVQVVQGD